LRRFRLYSDQLDHGTRRCYTHGCRCVACRDANAAATREHRARPVGTVDAAPARQHLAALRALGIGYRRAAHLARVAPATAQRVLAGTVSRLKPATAARLLATRPVLALGATVAGTKTWRFVDSLRREGFTHREIAFRLGAHSQQLQLHRRVRVRSALKVAQLYQTLTGDRRPA